MVPIEALVRFDRVLFISPESGLGLLSLGHGSDTRLDIE
jgi:hypothetical protein